MSSHAPQMADPGSAAAFDPSSAAGGAATAPPPTPVTQFIDAYREHGHRRARLDPLARVPLPDVPELRLRFHGLDPAQKRDPASAVLPTATTMQELEWQLKRVYCGAIGLDCSSVRKRQRRAWLYARMEAELLAPPLAPDQKRRLLRRLVAAEMWERLVGSTFEHAKRFSLEGCESLVPLLDTLVEEGAGHGVRQVFLGMPHRGRLNTLVNVMGVDARGMLDRLDPDSDIAFTQRDLPYHLGGRAHRLVGDDEVTLVLAPNPSHLQSVYPVVCGMARAHVDEHPGTPCLLVMVHGDAAFAGQGVVMETLNLTRRSGYTAGGVVHVIVNNQIGFTTPNLMDVRAHDYCTDVTRMVDAPVLHVNADDPEAVVRAARIAIAYRMEHGADIVIDLIGYRRLGHSEHDTPAVTQPALHAAIAAHPTVTELYHGASEEPARLADLREAAVGDLLTDPDAGPRVADDSLPPGAVRHQLQPASLQRVQALTQTLTTPPDEALLHDVVRGLCERWRATVSSDAHTVDWCLAENLAHATLLEEGRSIRLSGMDVGRGTFMHRHAVWHSQATLSDEGRRYVPLQHVAPCQGTFDIVNSPLSEEAALGFEYGYSVQTRTRLTLWEAQFGDFVNGAQVFIDQYIASGEYKWGCQSALAMLLPHGHEGVGPEHSNGFLGRFLQLCADDNMRVVMPSTSGQWFHLLREQAALATPKPLIVMSPKTQLHGNPRSHSRVQDLTDGHFMPVLADASVVDPGTVTRVVLCSGKFFYELHAQRQHEARADVALVRVEQLYPFPQEALAAALAVFPNLKEIVWAQEEDANQGAWRFVRDALEACVPEGSRLAGVFRSATPSGAHASVRAHQAEQRRLVAAAFGAL
ncbi:2-oxoglutarate dehydrogenase E1 component [Ralstonia pickettii]|uniref:2-oxoglutarate dehydrogenase E1 component n=1 Tax=Ralstonia pickettii TaxID=329 RepID=UPI002714EC7F|nr:2-oxoglutarate dehydrogenase E1 component [Ralstonia pickettii]WKZ87813.1 2-oxoglutarate dehydrogenase E1 component [Ralstonia pickettii]